MSEELADRLRRVYAAEDTRVTDRELFQRFRRLAERIIEDYGPSTDGMPRPAAFKRALTLGGSLMLHLERDTEGRDDDTVYELWRTALEGSRLGRPEIE